MTDTASGAEASAAPSQLTEGAKASCIFLPQQVTNSAMNSAATQLSLPL
eukprot:COSAG02_NODE_44765_length_363_cov_0.768939_1_plen_48_part_10